ncbi:MAG TPA: hypothetical protein VES97_03680 [Solirubrobacteraceae bacterium]|nr:hypothetical protein [Solirubrobacteraceae bacterium]
MLAALLTAGVSLVVSVVAGWFSRKTAQESERLRYSHEALTRLRGATGALRLDLFLAARSFARRLDQYYDGRPTRPLPLRTEREGAPPRDYHAGGLLIYRLLRPLTVGEIIERQTFYGDLMLDPATREVLRFDHAAVEMLTGARIGEGLPDFEIESCWDPEAGGLGGHPGNEAGCDPFQRVRSSYLRTAAAALVVPASGPQEPGRCMTHAEFLEHWEHPKKYRKFHEALEPVKRTIDRFSPMENPVFWLRLVGYAYACTWFHEQVIGEVFPENLGEQVAATWRKVTGRRERLKYEPLVLDVVDMLKKEDSTAAAKPTKASEYLRDHAKEYERKFEEIVRIAL